MGKDCGREFAPDATKKVITPQTWELIDTLWLVKIPRAGSARVTGISADVLQAYVNRTAETVPCVA